MTFKINRSWPVTAACCLCLAAALNLPARAATWDIDQKMNEATARAMLNRFGYGADAYSLAAARQQSPRGYLMQSIRGSTTLPAAISAQIQALSVSQPVEDIWSEYGPGGSHRIDAMDPDAKKAMQKSERVFATDAIEARLLTMANSDQQGHEVLLSFWLNHFSIFAPKGLDKMLAWDYARHIEQAMADDSFESLLRASFYHPAMQIYLDNAQSTAPASQAAQQAARRGKTLGINENLARELMELHTLGVDSGYTQNDVQELARIITGAGVYAPRMRERALEQAGATRIGLFLFDPRRHDAGEKVFLGQTFPAGHGLDEIDRALHLLAASPATAHHVALKLATRFLSDTPPKAVVDAMSEGYLQSGGRISATLLPLLKSRAFAESLAASAKFKQPLDYVLSASRAACSGTPIGNARLLMKLAMDMGEAPFMHTTPDGYALREANWLSPAAMAKRTRMAMGIAADRLPLASGVEDDEQAPNSPPPMSMTDRPQLRKMQGTACAANLSTVLEMVGPLSAATQSAQQGLTDQERIGLLLASPEFMQR